MSEVTEKDCQTPQLCKDDAMDRKKWRMLIKDVVFSVITTNKCWV